MSGDIRCSDCGTTLGELNRDQTGDLLCFRCNLKRPRAGDTAPLPRNGGTPRTSSRFALRPAQLDRVQPFRWAWRHRILLGYLNLLVGDEGVGKGTFLAWLVARLTRGELPGDLAGNPARVLMIGDEDGFNGVTVPRLHAAGADLSMVIDLHASGDQPLDIKSDADDLRRILAVGGFRVVIFDQLLDNLGVNVDDWRGKQVREAVRPLRALSADVGVATLAALHTNKSRTGSFRERVSGTQAFNALSRSSLLLAEHPDDADRRVVARGKGNYAKAPASIEFRLESRALRINGHDMEIGVAADICETAMTAADLLANREPDTKASAGRRVITTALEDGDWHEAAAILNELADLDIGDREARRLAADLGIERKRSTGFPSHMLWRSPARARVGVPDSHTSRTSRTAENTGDSTSAATPATAVVRQAPDVFTGQEALAVNGHDPDAELTRLTAKFGDAA